MGRNARQDAYNQQTANQAASAGDAIQAANAIPNDLTAGQKSGITQATMGGIDTSFQNANDEMMRRESASGSSAGVPETQLEMAREGAQQKSQAGAGLQEYFANVPIQRSLAKAGIYLPLAGQNAEMANAVAPQAQPSMFSQIFNPLMSAAGTAASG